MKVFAVLFILFAAASADVCYPEVQEICSKGLASPKDCGAKYGIFKHDSSTVQDDLHKYVNAQIKASFEYLLMSSIFGNYQINRDGFKSLYRKLSDKSWDDAADLLKYIAQRGGQMNFGKSADLKASVVGKQELSELHSLAVALDIQKELAEKSLHIHSEALKHDKKDGSIAHYLEERFIEPQAECVRNLAGYITDLKKFFTPSSAEPVSVFIFDEYLQKSL